ncbi:hypothetical protein HD554DRAFT_2034524 [Boletus coccyginus]|nr:hypothetical protein HD554DRAFT_2034524 [Boletus coccyginus]
MAPTGLEDAQGLRASLSPLSVNPSRRIVQILRCDATLIIGSSHGHHRREYEQRQITNEMNCTWTRLAATFIVLGLFRAGRPASYSEDLAYLAGRGVWIGATAIPCSIPSTSLFETERMPSPIAIGASDSAIPTYLRLAIQKSIQMHYGTPYATRCNSTGFRGVHKTVLQGRPVPFTQVLFAARLRPNAAGEQPRCHFGTSAMRAALSRGNVCRGDLSCESGVPVKSESLFCQRSQLSSVAVPVKSVDKKSSGGGRDMEVLSA